MLPLVSSGADVSAAAFQQLFDEYSSNTWSVRVRRFRGTGKCGPQLYMVFTNQDKFSLQSFVGEAETTLPLGKPVTCALRSRKQDITGESPSTACNGLQELSRSSRKLREQFGDQRDKDFLRRIVNEMRPDV
jgi:hypothetical protein